MITIRMEASPIMRLEDVFRAAPARARRVYVRAINHTLGVTTTAVSRAIAAQTGLGVRRVKRDLKPIRARSGALEARIVARGSYLALSEFKPRQTRKGISAAPWGKRRLFEHTFGLASLGGVYKRIGPRRLPIDQLWGPAIPKEMVRDQSEQAFHETVARHLPRRLGHELGRVLSRR